jgi:hypothetical protein
MSVIESFDDVRRLTEAELRTLLESGLPEHRVWAIWALALKSSAEVDVLAQRSEPDPGVRRNFAIVLAGHGHYDLLVALAKRDPAIVVRASAMQLVTRIAVDGKLPDAIVRERVAADGADVKVAVLGTIATNAPPWLVEIAEQLLEDADTDVRYEAFEALCRCGREGTASLWLEEAPEAQARMIIVRWTAQGRTKQAAEALAKSSRRLRRLLIECVRVATWHELAPSIGDDIMVLRALLKRTPALVDQVPLALLVRDALEDRQGNWVGLIAARLDAVSAPDASLATLLPDLCELCSARIGALNMAAAELRGRRDQDVYTEIDLEQIDDQRTVYDRCLTQALRLLVH